MLAESTFPQKAQLLTIQLARREGQLIKHLKRISNDLDEVARDLWQETKANHIARKCEGLVVDLQDIIK